MRLTVSELAQRIGAGLEGDGSAMVGRVANLHTAGPEDVSFLTDRAYRSSLADTKAAAVIVTGADAPLVPTCALVMDNPYLGFARAAQIFDVTPPWARGVSSQAVIAPDAKIGEGASVGAGAVIEEGAEIGSMAVIGPGVVIGRGAKVGARSKLHPNCVLGHGCEIGSDCLIQAGAVIGSDGFGYANDRGAWVKIPQCGRVIIGDHVEIGAQTAIDRGAVDDTVIESNVIIDNLCQIAHNVRIGSGTAIAGCVTIAGSVTIGRGCIIGGRSVLNGHISLEDGVTLTGDSSVMRGLKKGVYSSVLPVLPIKEWWRNTGRLLRMDLVHKQLSDLKGEIRELKKALSEEDPRD